MVSVSAPSMFIIVSKPMSFSIELITNRSQPFCSMNSVNQRKQVKRKDWKCAYLNPTKICQRAINPIYNLNEPKFKNKSPKEVEEIQMKLRDDARSDVATYIFKCFMKWQDRQCIIATYNFR